MKIPFNKTYFTGKEKIYIEQVLERGHLAGDGFFTERVSTFLEDIFSLNKVLMTPSATHALEMAVALLDPAAGDEFIMPSFTFPSTANAVLNRKARPVFAEIRSDTLNIDPADIETKITARTKAIIPVHYAGVGCRMDEIMEIADRYNLYVIEDAAQGVNASYRGQYLGSFGQLGCYSFHGSKNYTCGEGGALVINSDDDSLLKQAEIIREKGTNRAGFMRGEIAKYTWQDWGSSYIPSELQMAFLLAQLEEMDKIKRLRKKIYDFYSRQLSPFLERKFLQGISIIPTDIDSNYHLFFLCLQNREQRDQVLKKLNQRGIEACFHYIPLHLSPRGRRLGYEEGDLPRTEKMASTMLRLPLFTGMTRSEMELVVEEVIEVFEEI